MSYVESTASIRKKTKEAVRVESLIPDALREKSATLIEFLQDYYDLVNRDGTSSYFVTVQPGSGTYTVGESIESYTATGGTISATVAKFENNVLLLHNADGVFALGEPITGVVSDTTRTISSITNVYDNPSYEVNRIMEERDIDRATDRYLEILQRETAINVPGKFTQKDINLYKNLLKYYSMRGSENSIELFFRIIFKQSAEVYYPYTDTLKPSSGAWNSTTQKYDDTNGFLSSTKKLHDSYYYQRYSYVVKTGLNVDEWRNPFNRLVHPAGFIFFGQIFLVLEAIYNLTDRLNSRMPLAQPGLITPADLVNLIELAYADYITFDVLGNPVLNQQNMRALADLAVILHLELQHEMIAASKRTLESTKFINENPISRYITYTIQECINSAIPYDHTGAVITQRNF